MQACGCASTACKGVSVHTVCKHRGVQVWMYKPAVHPCAVVHADGCEHAWLCACARMHTRVSAVTRVWAHRYAGKIPAGFPPPSPWQPTDGERAGGCKPGGGSTSNLPPHGPKSQHGAKPPQGCCRTAPPAPRQAGPPRSLLPAPPCCARGSPRPLNSRVNHSWGRGARAAANPPWPQPGLAGELRPSRRGARGAGGGPYS